MSKISFNFGLLPPEFSSWDNSKAVIIPAPYEKTTTYGKGTADGPKAIMNASENMELYDIDLGLEPCEIGIHTFPFPDESLMAAPDVMLDYIRSTTKRVVEAKKFPVTIGGEHTVSLGPVSALCEKYPSLTVLSLDAHSDLRDEYEGDRYSHACVMRRISGKCHVVEAGIRSMDISEKPVIDENAIPVFTPEDVLYDNSFPERLLPELSEYVYISIDVDVFDPSIMPSTGTPEPGGLGWYDVLRILSAVANEKQVVGFDIVELAPINGFPAPDFMAAKLLYKMLGFVFFE